MKEVIESIMLTMKLKKLLIYPVMVVEKFKDPKKQRIFSFYCRFSTIFCYRQPLIGRLILRDGKLDLNKISPHDATCQPTELNKLRAEQIDRQMRCDIETFETTEVKSVWRQGQKEALKLDVSENRDALSEGSVSLSYPSWPAVRRSFNRRGQQNNPRFNKLNIFAVPLRFELTEEGNKREENGMKAGLEYRLQYIFIYLRFTI
jgi:hypothetical protein